jgi:hypothetical protein
MYGTSLGGYSGVGEIIYEIDVTTLTATPLFDTNFNSGTQNGPNGNAYDPVNNRFYYSTYVSPEKLYFYNFTHPVNHLSGSLPGGKVACAGWYDGEYYYIPQDTNDVYKVNFTADGTIDAATKICDIPDIHSFGDIVITSDGLMYGSSGASGTGKFWSLNLTDCTFEYINNLAHMQLAFGSDGVLYGHDAGNANFYTIDPVLGTRTLIGSINGLKFTDLSSGPYEPCEPQDETAWAYCEENGGDFPGNNWATYVTYELCEPCS